MNQFTKYNLSRNINATILHEEECLHKPIMIAQSRQIFSIKDHILNTSGFVGHLVLVTTTQLCHGTVKVGLNNMNKFSHI